MVCEDISLIVLYKGGDMDAVCRMRRVSLNLSVLPARTGTYDVEYVLGGRESRLPRTLLKKVSVETTTTGRKKRTRGTVYDPDKCTYRSLHLFCSCTQVRRRS